MDHDSDSVHITLSVHHALMSLLSGDGPVLQDSIQDVCASILSASLQLVIMAQKL